MLNRKHIRIKVMQVLYGLESNTGTVISEDIAVRTLKKDSEKLHDLYLYLMLFIKELAYHTLRQDDEVLNRRIIEDGDLKHIHKFWNDPLIQSIVNDPSLEKEIRKRNILWSGDADVIRKIYQEIKETKEYKTLIEDDKSHNSLTFLTGILKKYTTDYDVLTSHFEDLFINWEDDRIQAYDIAVKTLKALNNKNLYPEKSSEYQVLHIEDLDGEVGTFAQNLLKLNISHRQILQDILIPKLEKWESSQIAMLDYIIMRMAISEFLYFETIPFQVTVNEYLEITKQYSTPESKKLVNGILDFAYKQLETEGKINKIDFIKKVN